MTLRPAFPDELGRAKALLEGHPVPPSAAFLLAVKEQPVERILAAIPWWLEPARDDGGAPQLRFHLPGSRHLDAETVQRILRHLDALAAELDAHSLSPDFYLPPEHPLFLQLTGHGYEISRTDRYLSAPGELGKRRVFQVHARLRSRIPGHWRTEGIRGQDPQKILALASTHHLISAQQFQHYWNGASRERFEDDYSRVLIADGEIIGIYLLSVRGGDDLHVHVEAASPEHAAHSALISASLRYASCSRLPEGFPRVVTFRADSAKHRQTFNTALRMGGTELTPRHFFRKTLSARE